MSRRIETDDDIAIPARFVEDVTISESSTEKSSEVPEPAEPFEARQSDDKDGSVKHDASFDEPMETSSRNDSSNLGIDDTSAESSSIPKKKIRRRNANDDVLAEAAWIIGDVTSSESTTRRVSKPTNFRNYQEPAPMIEKKRKSELEMEESPAAKRQNVKGSDGSSSEQKEVKEYGFLNFYTAQSIKYEYNKHYDELTDFEKTEFRKIFDQYEETNISPEIPYERDEKYEGLQKLLEDAMSNGYKGQTGKSSNRKHKGPEAGDKTPLNLLTVTNPSFTEFSSAIEIIEAANQWSINMDNVVFDSKNFKQVLYCATLKNDKETSFFDKRGFETAGEKGQRLPIVVLEVKKGFDEKVVEKQANSLTSCIIRGFTKAINLDVAKFDLDVVTKLKPNEKIEMIRNRPQHSTTNFSMYGDGISPEYNQWNGDNIVELDRKLIEFTMNHNEIKAIVSKGFQDLRENWPQRETILKALQSKLREIQLPLMTPREIHPSAVVASFGSNVNLMGIEYKEQLEEVLKLPSFLHPKEGLLKFCDSELPGINEVQMYYKAPGSRTNGHLENQVLASINWNLGPEPCTWFMIPMCDIGKLEQFMIKKRCRRYHDVFWPNEEELLEAGISFQKVLQKEDDLIYVGIGTYHYVQSNGFSKSVSWNVAQASEIQLLASGLIYDNNAVHRQMNMVPIVPMMWKMAEEKFKEGTEFASIVKRFLIPSLAQNVFDRHAATLKNLVIESANKCPFDVAMAGCPRMYCHRKTLHNIYAIEHWNDKISNFSCINCLRSGNEKKPNRVHCYQKYTPKELGTIFDTYKPFTSSDDMEASTSSAPST